VRCLCQFVENPCVNSPLVDGTRKTRVRRKERVCPRRHSSTAKVGQWPTTDDEKVRRKRSKSDVVMRDGTRISLRPIADDGDVSPVGQMVHVNARTPATRKSSGTRGRKGDIACLARTVTRLFVGFSSRITHGPQRRISALDGRD